MKKFLSSNIFFLFILFVICFAIYGKAINFGLTHLDDDQLTSKNINYISDYKNIPNFFKTDCYHGSMHIYYRPLLGLSFSLETIFFKYNKKVYHTTNIILFVLALFIIFIFLKLLNCNSIILKFFIVLCAAHPVLASVPAWLPARNDSLLVIFVISSFIFFINYLNTQKFCYLFLYLFFYVLSVFTKETALPMVIIFPLLAFFFFTSSPIKLKHKLLNGFCLTAIILFYFFMRHNSTTFKVNFISYFSNCRLYFENIVTGTMNYLSYILFPDHFILIFFIWLLIFCSTFYYFSFFINFLF